LAAPVRHRLLFVLAVLLAVGSAFCLLLWGSDLEAETINLGTLFGGDDPDPQISLLTAGLVLGVAAALVTGAAIVLRPSKR
jgi:hypothetical protein